VGILRRIFSRGWIGFLLLCWIVLLLWIRSGHVVDTISYDALAGKNGTGDLGIYLESGEGKISLICDGASHMSSSGLRWWKLSVREMNSTMTLAHPLRWNLQPSSMGWHLGPFGLRIWDWRFKLVMPYWSILLISGIWPAVVFRRWRRRRRRLALGCCSSCGYDLRATLGRCPECGMIASGVKG
jgi:hypothetical protein